MDDGETPFDDPQGTLTQEGDYMVRKLACSNHDMRFSPDAAMEHVKTIHVKVDGETYVYPVKVEYLHPMKPNNLIAKPQSLKPKPEPGKGYS